jgi:hypothetical protein
VGVRNIGCLTEAADRRRLCVVSWHNMHCEADYVGGYVTDWVLQFLRDFYVLCIRILEADNLRDMGSVI